MLALRHAILTQVCGFPPFHQANASASPHIIKVLKTTAVMYTSVTGRSVCTTHIKLKMFLKPKLQLRISAVIFY